MIFWPATFWMTVVEEVLVAELPGELAAGFTAGLGAADSPVTVMPVCPITELPGLCTCTGLVWAFTGRVITAYGKTKRQPVSRLTQY